VVGRTACGTCVSNTCVSGRQLGRRVIPVSVVGRTACDACVSGRQDGVLYLCEIPV